MCVPYVGLAMVWLVAHKYPKPTLTFNNWNNPSLFELLTFKGFIIESMLEVLATADDLDHTDIAQQQADTEPKEQTKNAANFVFLLHRQESTHYASPPPPHAACYNRSLAAAAIIIMVHMAIITFALRRTGLQMRKKTMKNAHVF